MNDKLIARVLGRNDLSVLLTTELHKPLFINPSMISATVKSLLQVNTDKVKTDRGGNTSSINSYFIDDNKGLVFEINGALVDREMSTPCAVSPASYEALLYGVESALNAEHKPEYIIGRFDSHGGMAAGMLETASAINQLRKDNPDTKFYASIDSSCYSAAFGLAVAFGEIWIPSTGGAGSVGVVRRHVDTSEAEKKEGLQTKYIYAGKKKVLGNPSVPLSDSDLSELQTEINTLYDMFTSSVAEMLDCSVSSVKETEAACYMGQSAIDVGFAHKLGTFKELKTFLSNTSTGEIDTVTTQAELDAKAAELAKLESDLLAATAKLEAEKSAELEAAAHTAELTKLITLAGLTGAAANVILSTNPTLENAKIMITEMTKTNHDINYAKREAAQKKAVDEWADNVGGIE